ncbi:hypothetical protein QYE76_041555 [Lolium multiflorum]|uniref:Transposase (putative) gypsy type domain-containing protein n=1 Tax=Lolium multiflorum TaxID=4521 RepID=A0AAD8TF77_LOLMU|nr:hypothetical protein QYE76_041555 [Lolium multiflorum]
MIFPNWSFMADSTSPHPKEDECILTKAWVERGLSLPCSEFFLSILSTYGLQPHNICPNSYLLSNFVTLCEGHLGIRPVVRLWQFFFRVKKETKDKDMVNCGSMTFMLRPGRMYPPHSSHESVRYWNAGWFYVKNIKVPGVHEGLPIFVNKPPEELDSWSFVPTLVHFPILEKTARRIFWLVHDGLNGNDLTLSWFSRRIQPLRYNSRLISEYTGVDDELRVSRHDLPADSLKGRIKTLVKIGRGQLVLELLKDIKINNQCPPLSTLAEEDFRAVLRVPVSGGPAEEDPEEDDEEEEQAPKNVAPRPTKRPRAKVSGTDAGASGEASAKKAKFVKPPSLESRKVERDRLRLLTTTGKRNPTTTTTRTNTQEPITKYMKKSPAVGPPTPAPPSSSHAAPEPSPPELNPHPHLLPLHRNHIGASSSLATTSTELENLRSSYQNLEKNLAEVKQKQEQVEKQLTEKSSELIQKEGEFQMKKQADSDTIQKQEKEINGLRRYMETAEKHWDLLNADVMEPLGYNEEHRDQFPRDDLLQLAGDDCKDLISACRKIFHNLAIKNSRTCEVRKLIQRMDILPGLVRDLQASTAQGAAAMSLAMCLAHNPKLNIDRVTSGVPADSDVNALLDAVSGYDTRIARRIRHDEFFDKVVLPADEPLEAELQKEQEAEARPAEFGSQYTWTSSKEAKKNKSKDSASSPSEEDEESDDDDVSSPVQDEEKGEPKADDKGCSSPAKGE